MEFNRDRNEKTKETRLNRKSEEERGCEKEKKRQSRGKRRMNK